MEKLRESEEISGRDIVRLDTTVERYDDTAQEAGTLLSSGEIDTTDESTVIEKLSRSFREGRKSSNVEGELSAVVSETIGGPYKAFDPDLRLKDIRMLSRNDSETIETYLLKKRGLVDEFKKSRTEQVMERMMLDRDLEDILLEKGAFDEGRRNRMQELIHKRAAKAQLSASQLQSYDSFLDKVSERNHQLDEVASGVDFNDEKELARKLLGIRPKGEIRIERGSVSFFIEMRNPWDLSKVRKDASLRDVIRTVVTVGGFQRGLVTVIRNDGGLMHFPERLKNIKKHEHRHAVYSCIRAFMNECMYHEKEYPDLIPENISAYAKRFRIDAQDLAKNEILAYLKDGSSTWSFEDNFYTPKNAGGGYDYFASEMEWVANNQSSHSLDEGGLRELRESLAAERGQYLKDVASAMRSVKLLRRSGLSSDEVVALLNLVPLTSWEKEVRRLEIQRSGGLTSIFDGISYFLTGRQK